nr:unnamed protein product [Digitaria exilis]
MIDVDLGASKQGLAAVLSVWPRRSSRRPFNLVPPRPPKPPSWRRRGAITTRDLGWAKERERVLLGYDEDGDGVERRQRFIGAITTGVEIVGRKRSR